MGDILFSWALIAARLVQFRVGELHVVITALSVTGEEVNRRLRLQVLRHNIYSNAMLYS